MVNTRKCAVIGCGFVGSTTAFTLMQNGLFSEIVLIDANEKKASGEAMDLNHGMLFAKPARIYSGQYKDVADCQVVIIAAGAAQKPGETRIDLVKKNTAIFKTIISEILRYNTTCILLVVTNPVDILTYVTRRLSGFDSNRVIGSGTVLDTARLRFLVGEHLRVDARNVDAMVIGEHGDSELAVWSRASISGVPAKDFCANCGKCLNMHEMNHLFDDVKQSAYRIIESKGATYYAVALAVTRIIEAITRDENSVLTVSVFPEGRYGLKDVCLGLPAIVGKNGIVQVLEIPLSDEEKEKLYQSAKTLQEIADGLDL